MKESIFSGYFGKLHCQGIALDLARGYIYYSFTTMLVKADLDGNVIVNLFVVIISLLLYPLLQVCLYQQASLFCIYSLKDLKD